MRLFFSIQRAASEVSSNNLPPLPPKTRTPSVSSIYDNHRASESDTSSVFTSVSQSETQHPEVSYAERKYGSSTGFRSASFSGADSPSIRVRFRPSPSSDVTVESEVPLRLTDDVTSSSNSSRLLERLVSCETGSRSASFSITKSMSEEKHHVLVQPSNMMSSSTGGGHFLLDVRATNALERRLSQYDNCSSGARPNGAGASTMTSSSPAPTTRDEFASVTQQLSQLAFDAGALRGPDSPSQQTQTAPELPEKQQRHNLSASFDASTHKHQLLRSSLASNNRQEVTSSENMFKQKRSVRFAADFEAPRDSAVSPPPASLVMRASKSNYEFSHSHNFVTSSTQQGDGFMTSASASQFEQRAYSSVTATAAHVQTPDVQPPPLPPKQHRHGVKSYMQIFGAPTSPEMGEEAAARHSQWLRSIMPPLYYFEPNLSAHLSALSGFHTPFPTLQVPNMQGFLPADYSDDDSSRASDVFSLPAYDDVEGSLQLTPPFPRKFPKVCQTL